MISVSNLNVLSLLDKLRNNVGRTVKYTFTVFVLMFLASVGSELKAQNPITGLTLTSTVIDEAQPVGTAVGAFNTIDVDPTARFTYAFAAGAGGADNGAFTIYLNKLQTAQVFNYSVRTQYNIRVSTTDTLGNEYEAAFVVNVNHIPPTVSIIRKVVVQGQSLTFTASDFTSSFTAVDNMSLTKVKFPLLPPRGVMTLNGTNVQAGADILVADIPNLVYTAPDSFRGVVAFSWNGSDPVMYATNVAKVGIYVRSANSADSSNAIVLHGAGGNSGRTHSSHFTIDSNVRTPGGIYIPGNNVASSSQLHAGSSTYIPGGGHDAYYSPTTIAGVQVQYVKPALLSHNCRPSSSGDAVAIEYQLPAEGKVEVKILSHDGKEVKSLTDEMQAAGSHSISWNGESNIGDEAESGTYFYTIALRDATGNKVATNSGTITKQ